MIGRVSDRRSISTKPALRNAASRPVKTQGSGALSLCGDVYLADLDPVKGSEQAGRRPVLIFEDDRLIRATLIVVGVPFTINVTMQNLPTCVLVPADEGGLRQDSVAICHQIRALDKHGLVAQWGSLPTARVAEIERAALRTLGVSFAH
ncbi:MAG: type II toxin-antitoxin system PemK/MazF family toxin [Anaerolineae bacterium]